MNEQEISETDKLIIVESGKNRRGAAASTSSSELPLTFTRQVIGRHVIYKSIDGVKLRSLAEARRFFKQRRQVLVDSEFDFSPPALDTEAKKKTISLDSTSAAASKTVRGRLKRPVSSPKVSHIKSTASSRRKELVDDLKTIRDSLKDDENEGKNQETPSTSEPLNKTPRGRPKRQAQSPMEEAGRSAVGALPDDELVSTKDEPSPEGNKGRPTRQRRPNQRYTDLISETESSRKKPRKDSAGAESVTRKDLTSEKVNSAARIPILPGITAIKTFSMTETKRDFRTSLDKGAPSIQSKSSLPRQLGLQSFTSTSVATETFGSRSASLSPLPAGGFEAPPEFVDMQEQASQQEANVYRILPAVPTSSLLYTPPVPAGSNTAPTVQPTIVSTTIAPSTVSFKRLEMESATKQHQLYDKPNSPTLVSPVDQRRISKPVRRGRKPAGSEAPELISDVWQQFGQPMAEEPASGRRGESISRRYDHGSKVIRARGLSPDIEMQPHYGSNIVTGRYSGPRGLAKLQHGGSKRTMTIGRYGAASSTASVLLRDPPPQLEPYGGGEPIVERNKTQKTAKVQQRGARQSEPADSTLFCHLPPEIVGDHCYGRQPDPTVGTSGGQKAVLAAIKTGNGQPYGSSPPPLLRVESQRRSLPSEQSSQNFGSTSPSYQSQRYRTTSSNFNSYQNMEVAGFTDLGSSSGGASATIGGQQVAILGDKLPANILEEDDGEISGELVTSVSIH